MSLLCSRHQARMSVARGQPQGKRTWRGKARGTRGAMAGDKNKPVVRGADSTRGLHCLGCLLHSTGLFPLHLGLLLLDRLGSTGSRGGCNLEPAKQFSHQHHWEQSLAVHATKQGTCMLVLPLDMTLTAPLLLSSDAIPCLVAFSHLHSSSFLLTERPLLPSCT